MLARKYYIGKVYNMPPKSKSKVRIPVRKGTLPGYHPYNKPNTRHHALLVVLKREAPLPVFRKLGALMVLTKRTIPKASKVYKANRNWVKRERMI
jgi:hypothetical protein